MIYRTRINNLRNWRAEKKRKPLILRGARQVGKTTLVKQFSQEFDFFISLNLEKIKDKNYFDKFEDLDEIVENLFIDKGVDKLSKSVLIFIDEIQECPKAIKLLRYFYEDYPQYFVISAGSLLEFSLADVSSFPVGRVDYMTLYPLHFKEFLQAFSREDILPYLENTSQKNPAHQFLLKQFGQFAILGGMPEVVQNFLNEKNYFALQKIYTQIWRSYKEDVPKYARNPSQRLISQFIIDQLPYQIDKRIKFANFGNSQYRAREIRECLISLSLAGLLKILYPLTSTDLPLNSLRKNAPRLQFLDTGLLNFTLGLQGEMLKVSQLGSVHKGKIIQHIVGQEMLAMSPSLEPQLHFWIRDKKNSSAEIDYIVEYQSQVFPVEVKSGATGTLKSLHLYMQEVGAPFALRLYGGTLQVDEIKLSKGFSYKLVNLPYYLAGNLEFYIAYFINHFKL